MGETIEERIEALCGRRDQVAGIRRGFLAHLGESMLPEVRNNPSLSSGREDILAGIERCDRERVRLEDEIAALDARLFAHRAETGHLSMETGAPEEASVASDAQDIAEPVKEADAAVPEMPVESIVDAPMDGQEAFAEPVADLGSEVPAGEPGTDVAEVAQVQVEPEAVPDSADGTLRCPQCGSPIEATHKFCMSCGQRLQH